MSSVGHPGVARGVALVEGVGGELLPVGPYFLEHFGVVAVALAALDELGLHGVDDVFLLLTHRLAQGVALASGEVGQLAAQEHDLLLVDGDAVGVFQVLLHAGDVVLDFGASVLAVDEVGDVVHGSRPVEGVHGDEVFEHGGVELAEVFLHTRRLKLEGADGLSLLVELVGELVVDGYLVEIHVDAFRLFHVLHGLLQLGECLQSEEVHLDESRRLDDVAVVLRAIGLLVLVVGVVGRRHGHPV